MAARHPIYVEVDSDEEFDAWLEREGVRTPLKLRSDAVDALNARRPPGVDDKTARIMDVVAKVARCMPDARTIATISAVSRVMAAVQRHGIPAVVSTSPLSPDEAARLMRDVPRLSEAERAVFAAIARSMPKDSALAPWTDERT